MAYWFAQRKISHKYDARYRSHWVTMTESNSIDVSKKLSVKEALEEYDKLFSQEAANIIKAYKNTDRLLFLLKVAGYSQTEAITKMAEDAKRLGLKGFSEASIRYKLSDESKKNTKPGPRKSNRTVTSVRPDPNQVRLVVPEEPKIPPPPQVIQEIEPEPERQPPKPIEEPIAVPQKPRIIDIIFAPAAIDMMDTSQAFIIQYDLIANKVKKYKTVGRRTVTVT